MKTYRMRVEVCVPAESATAAVDRLRRLVSLLDEAAAEQGGNLSAVDYASLREVEARGEEGQGRLL